MPPWYRCLQSPLDEISSEVSNNHLCPLILGFMIISLNPAVRASLVRDLLLNRIRCLGGSSANQSAPNFLLP